MVRKGSNFGGDQVYDHPDVPVAFELTNGKSHTTRGLLAFQKRFSKFEGRCFLVSADPQLKMPSGIMPGKMPIDLYLLAVGRQEQFALARRIESHAKKRDGQMLLFF